MAVLAFAYLPSDEGDAPVELVLRLWPEALVGAGVLAVVEWRFWYHRPSHVYPDATWPERLIDPCVSFHHMRRRDYVSMFATGLVGYAGARAQQSTETGRTNESTSQPANCRTETSTGTGTSSPAQTETESTGTTTGTSGSNIEIASTEYVEVEGEFSTTAGVWVTVANTGDFPYSYVEVTASFRDAQDTIITNSYDNMLALPPGATWRTFLSHVEPDAVESATVEITDTTRGQPLPTAADLGLTVENARLTDDGSTVIGRVTNTTGGPLSYLEALVRFRDDQYIYGGTFTNVSNFAAGDTWRFEVSHTSLAPEPPTITDYDLRFST